MPATSVNIALDRFTTFGDLLKYLRRRSGLTQRELSIAVGYSDTQISRLEQNERLPDLATLTARFLPALHIEGQPEVAERLLELAATVRREDAPAVGLPPYKGLQFFDESDAGLFFGREALTNQLLEHLVERSSSNQRILAIIGASGSGKSSVVRAGLVPALHWQQATSAWPVMVMTPTAHPLEALAAVLTQETRQTQAVRKLVDELAQSTVALHNSSNRISSAAGVDHAVLFVDQFEELFTLCRSEVEQTAFVDNLVAAAFYPDGAALVVIVLRADFYAHCARFSTLRQALSQHQEYIGPMTTEELRRAIEEPARAGHWEFEPGLVDLLLHDVGAVPGQAPEPGALPLLSHALLTTWQRRRGRAMTLSGYTASGGVRCAIAETAEAVFYDQLEPEQREIARQIFLRLTELGGEASLADTRRRVSLGELVLKPGDKKIVHEVLLALADARLITTDQESAEVAHEALIREWPTLRGWLEEDREGLRLHRRLTDAAQEWEALGHEPEYLFRGARLAQAVEWAEAHPQDANQLERDFLLASRALQEKESLDREAQRLRELEAAKKLAETEHARAEEQIHSSQRLRQRAVLLTFALIAAGVLAVIALLNWQRSLQANHLAASRELAAAAVNNLQVDPERSALLALHALQEADTLEARNALRQAVPEMHLLRNIFAHEAGVPDVAYSPDGSRIATMGAFGEIKIWDAASGEQVAALNENPDQMAGSLAFSPTGEILAGAFVTRVILWDWEKGEIQVTFSGESVGTTTGYNLGVGQVSFSPNGSRLAVANLDGKSKIFDLITNREIVSFSAEELPSKAIAFSPDGMRLATGGDEGVVRVWDARSGAEIFARPLGGIIHSVAYSLDGTHLGAASEDGSVKVWDAATGEGIVSLPRLAGLYDAAFLADGRLATAGQDGTTRVWDPISGQELLTLAGPTSTVIGVAGSPDGSKIATGGYDGSLRIWDAAPGRELLTIPGHAAIAWNVAYSPDGKRMASAAVDGFVKIWDAETGVLLLTLPTGDAPASGFTTLAFSPDGSQLAGGGVDGTITLWNSQTGKLLTTLQGHSNFVLGLAFSPEGERLASSGWDGKAYVWDLTAGEAIATFNAKIRPAMLVGIAFSPDGKSIYTGVEMDRTAYQWDAATGKVIREFSGEGNEIYGSALSPDGRLLAGGTQAGDIILWDAATGAKLRTWSGHAGLLLRLAFNHDGTRLASADFDRLAKVWDVASGTELFSLYGNFSNVFGVSFHPDGLRLATSGADGTIRVYTTDPKTLVSLAQVRLTRTFTDEECRKYLHLKKCP